MASVEEGGEMEVSTNEPQRLSLLYPQVEERETHLPRQWSSKDKYSYIGLSQNNLRVHYKGSGKNQKDAAAVRANHPIPTGCGIYYYEVKIINKGRDGHIGIGMSGSGVNLNKLPGWEKSSYGYHADDGCVFSSSGTGQQFGPTFTTGDVVGCGFNLVERSIFFTKNGIRLGTAVSDVPASLQLYPTVGLQTPGEIVEGNFGEDPFVFDFRALLTEMKHKTRHQIQELHVPEGEGVWQANLHKLVLGYLVHHGYTSTAIAFANNTGQELEESQESMTNRQKIQALMMSGRVSQAVAMVNRLHPGLFEANQELLFRVLCHQFIETIAGYDSLPSRGGVSNEVNGEIEDENMETETKASPINLDKDPGAVEQLLLFGRELQSLFNQLSRKTQSATSNQQLQTLLQDVFSLLAYADPFSSPVAYLLDPSQREPVTSALNSAILKNNKPPLEFALGQASQCLHLMIDNGLGAAAFASVEELLKPNAPHSQPCIVQNNT